VSFRLYLDEHVHPAVGEHLRRLQHEVLTTQEARRPATSDEEQLAFAALENRVIITYDCADFAQLDAQWKAAGREHAGIVLCPTGLTVSVLCSRLARHLSGLTPEQHRNLLLWC